MYLKLIFITLLVLFSGCSNSPKPIKHITVTYPSWYSKPPLNSSLFTYGVGFGVNYKEARLESINMAISSLSIEVSSSFETNSTYKRENGIENVNKNIKSEINAVLQKIEINNFQVVDQQKIGFEKYISLIKIDNTKLVMFFKKKLSNLDKSLEAELSGVDGLLNQFLVYKKYIKLYQDNEKYSVIIGSLDKSYNSSFYFNKLKQLREVLLKTQEQIKFSVQSNNKDNDRLMAAISNSLLDSGIQIVKKDFNYVLKVKENLSYSQSKGIYIAVNNIDLKIYDKNNKIINGKNISVKGFSFNNKKEARLDTYKKFNVELQKNNTKLGLINFMLN